MFQRKPAVSSAEKETALSLLRLLKHVDAYGHRESRDSALRDGVSWKWVGEQFLQCRDVRLHFIAAKTTAALELPFCISEFAYFSRRLLSQAIAGLTGLHFLFHHSGLTGRS